MSAANYADLANQQCPSRRGLASANATEAALLGERDAVMLSALHNASMQRCGAAAACGATRGGVQWALRCARS